MSASGRRDRQTVQRTLAGVRTRLWLHAALQVFSAGLIASAVSIATASVVHRLIVAVPLVLTLTLGIAPLVLAFGIAACRRPTGAQAAAHVDRAWGEDALFATAWDLLDARTGPDLGAAGLVLHEAAARSPRVGARVRARHPLRAPRALPVSVFGIAAAAYLVSFPGALSVGVEPPAEAALDLAPAKQVERAPPTPVAEADGARTERGGRTGGVLGPDPDPAGPAQAAAGAFGGARSGGKVAGGAGDEPGRGPGSGDAGAPPEIDPASTRQVPIERSGAAGASRVPAGGLDVVEARVPDPAADLQPAAAAPAEVPFEPIFSPALQAYVDLVRSDTP